MLAMPQTVQDLQRARNLIADPEKWCQGAANDGERYCAIQADLFVRGLGRRGWERVNPLLIRAAAEQHPELMKYAIEPQPHRLVYLINDALGHEAVMRMYDRAIELALVGGG